MGVNKIVDQTNVSMVKLKQEKVIKKKEIKRQENVEELKDLCLNDIDIKEDRIESKKQAEEKVRSIKEKFNDRRSLKVMDKITEIREKVLSTLS